MDKAEFSQAQAFTVKVFRHHVIEMPLECLADNGLNTTVEMRS